MNIKKNLGNLIKKFGLQVIDYNLYTSPSLQARKLLDYHKIETIIDVGANTGQYAMDLRSDGYGGKIISFEPLSGVYSQLLKNSRNDNNWIVADRMALGSRDGTIDINVSANSVSSSVLPIMESHTGSAPESAYIGTENVPVRRLDSISETLGLTGNIFIKVDVQGYELDMLKGASDLLKKTKGLQLELSFLELYKGQPLTEDMQKYLKDIGFELYAVFPAFIDESSGRLLQADGIFFRKQPV